MTQTLICKVSTVSIWQLAQKSTIVKVCSALKGIQVNYTPLPPSSGMMVEEGPENNVRIRVVGAYKETLPSRHSNTDVHLDSENFWLHVQNLYKLGVIFQKYWKVSVYGLFPPKNPSRTVKQAFYNFNMYLIFNYRLWLINK